MSAQRRRVLEDIELGVPIDKISNGVYIEGLDRKAYTVDEWQGGSAANSIVVASGDIKFRIALKQTSGNIMMHFSGTDTIETCMPTATTYTSVAVADYNGAGNTTNIMKFQPSADYAAGYCKAFTFPDKKTRGYLPSLGQLNVAYQNKTAVTDALKACGGTSMSDQFYWSSTFWGVYYAGARRFWELYWKDGSFIEYGALDYAGYARPFADIT